MEILEYLSNLNGIVISIRTLRRILKRNHQYRRKEYNDILDVSLYLMELMHSSDKLHGYRFMHSKCIQVDVSSDKSLCDYCCR